MDGPNKPLARREVFMIFSGPREKPLQILGGGIAGLSAGFYSRRNNISFLIHEAAGRVGGNAITFRHGDFLYDSGAHRFHGEDLEVTAEIQGLMGNRLKKVEVPSYIYLDGKLVDFPLSPLNVLRKLGLPAFTKASFEVVGSRLKPWNKQGNFEDFALRAYGKTIAGLALLNYSEKLWGLEGESLSPAAAGKRLRGLNLRTFLIESVLGKRAKTNHLDGLFYYPEGGIGAIADRLAEFCGRERIVLGSRVTRVMHDGRRIRAFEVNGRDVLDAGPVISTLPLGFFLQILEPPPPPEVLDLAGRLRFRQVKLVAVFLNKNSVINAASIYFPDRKFPFTRVYEPKSRDVTLAPPGRTSLVAEIPFNNGDELGSLEEDKLTRLIGSHLVALGWINEAEILGATVHTLANAYPVFELGFEEKVEKIKAYLNGFSNLSLCGRNATFTYTWIHSLMRRAKKLIEEAISSNSEGSLSRA